MINRRNFLKQSVQLAGGLGLIGWASKPFFGCSKAPQSQTALFNISLAEWSLHRTIFDGKLDHLDFAKATKDDYGIDAVEYVNQFFSDKAKDADYLRQMKERADGEGVRSLLIMCDREGRLGDPDKKKRIQAVENHYKWVEAAKSLGCHSIRVNAWSEGSFEEQMKLAADGLRRLVEYGDQHGLNVIVENHGGLSSNGQWLAGVMKGVEHPRCGTLPDFGNFGNYGGHSFNEGRTPYDRYKGVEELMPYAKAVSAKSHSFDENGEEPDIDYLRMMKIVLDAGYRGYVGVEYEGDQMSEPEGIKATKNLLERVRGEVTKEYS